MTFYLNVFLDRVGVMAMKVNSEQEALQLIEQTRRAIERGSSYSPPVIGNADGFFLPDKVMGICIFRQEDPKMSEEEKRRIASLERMTKAHEKMAKSVEHGEDWRGEDE